MSGFYPGLIPVTHGIMEEEIEPHEVALCPPWVSLGVLPIIINLQGKSIGLGT